MRLNKYGRTSSPWKSDGWFVSFIASFGFIVLCFRPRYWRLDYIAIDPNKYKRRLYVGPFEFEITLIKGVLK